MKLVELTGTKTQMELLASAIEAAQDLIDGRYFSASEVVKDTGLPYDRALQIVEALQILRAIDTED